MSGQPPIVVELPFPPASLSGHAKGNWYGKSSATKKHRAWAAEATHAALNPDARQRLKALQAGKDDITVIIEFHPPDRRGDRTNYANRIKAYFDGLADALGVNDRRFLPVYRFYEPVKDRSRVIMSVQI